MDKKYQKVNGTSYDARTPRVVVQLLEDARVNRTRLTVDYGNTKTGKSWEDQYDIHGYVGRSCGGIYKIPLLVHNSRSMGGGGMLDHCIVAIYTSKGKHKLYAHPTYSTVKKY